MYFIIKGTVDIYNVSEVYKIGQDSIEGSFVCKENHIAMLRTGQYFGEIGLITKMKRTATVRAKDDVSLAKLSQASFQDIKNEFP